MQNLGIETAQNVIIRQDIANIGERIASQLVDYLIMFSYYRLMILFSDLFSTILPSIPYHEKE